MFLRNDSEPNIMTASQISWEQRAAAVCVFFASITLLQYFLALSARTALSSPLFEAGVTVKIL